MFTAHVTQTMLPENAECRDPDVTAAARSRGAEDKDSKHQHAAGERGRRGS